MVCVRVCFWVSMHIWRSEGHFVESIFSFHLQMGSRSSGSCTSILLTEPTLQVWVVVLIYCAVLERTTVVTMASPRAQIVTYRSAKFPLLLWPLLWHKASVCCLLLDTQPLVEPFGWTLSDSHCLGLVLHGWQSMEFVILYVDLNWKLGSRKRKTYVPWTALSSAYVSTVDGQVTSQPVGVGCMPLNWKLLVMR